MKETSAFIPIATAITLLGPLSDSALGALTVNDFTITATTVSFSVSGTVDPGFTPARFEPTIVFIGSPFPFDDWLTSEAALVSQSNGPGATSNLIYTNSSGTLSNAFGSDWFRFDSTTGAWAGGEVIDYSASFTGTFDLGVLPSSVLVVQGYGNANNLIATGSVAGSGSVPEPSSALLLAVAAMGLMHRRKHSE